MAGPINPHKGGHSKSTFFNVDALHRTTEEKTHQQSQPKRPQDDPRGLRCTHWTPHAPPRPPQGSPEVPNATQSPPLDPPRCVEWSLKLFQGPYFPMKQPTKVRHPTSKLQHPTNRPTPANQPTNQPTCRPSRTSDLQPPTSTHQCDGDNVGCPMLWGRRQGALAR